MCVALLLSLLFAVCAFGQLQPPDNCAAVDPSVDGACSTCVAILGCGWCPATRTCWNGTANGPAAGNTCLLGWVYGDTIRCPNCQARVSCVDCQMSPDCIWCKDPATTQYKCLDKGVALNGCLPALQNCECHRHAHCGSCNAEKNCYWCEAARRCFSSTDAPPAQCSNTIKTPCPVCGIHQVCQACLQSGCSWCGNTCLNSTDPCTTPTVNCDSTCQRYGECEPCTFTPGCQWCSNSGQCRGKDQVTDCVTATSCPYPSSFDAGSFFGGIALVVLLGLAAFGVVLLYRFYQRRKSYTVV